MVDVCMTVAINPCIVVRGSEEEEEEFITSGNWRGKHNSLSRGAGAVM
jgi:hypothetical protein